jgi:hypothetical protein
VARRRARRPTSSAPNRFQTGEGRVHSAIHQPATPFV